jgi:type IV pilus assembly protein PilP
MAAATCLLLGGCEEATMADLVSYADAVNSRPGSTLEPLCARLQCASLTASLERLDTRGWRGPFDPFPAATEPPPVNRTAMPDPHPAEALENYPLDSLRLMGSVEQDGSWWALLRAPDGLVHRVAPGNYLGRNNGKVLAISEARIDIGELVWNDATGWEDRAATLVLAGG